MLETLVTNWPDIEIVSSAGLSLFSGRQLERRDPKWGVEPHRVQLSDGNGATIEALYHLDRSGRIWRPPLSPGPYLPVTFDAPPGEPDARIEHQWLHLAQMLAEDMRERGLASRIALSPDIADIRPWQRQGFHVEVGYTYCVDLPYDRTHMRPEIRRVIAKSERAGFACVPTTDLADVYACLIETEQRKGFSSYLDVADLELLQHTLGKDALRAYACYSPDGEMAASAIELHKPGGRALGWLAGTKTAYLSSGVSQHLYAYIFDDLAAAGATSYDFGGANIFSIAAAKAQWGGRLVPYYRLESGSPRDFARLARSYWRFHRATS